MQFLSYLSKHFTHLYNKSFVWRRHIRGQKLSTNDQSMAAGNQQKRLEVTFSIKALCFRSRAGIRAHKHVFQYLKWLNCWKSTGETFLNKKSFLFWCQALWKLGSSHCCFFEMKQASGMENGRKKKIPSRVSLARARSFLRPFTSYFLLRRLISETVLM